MSPGSLLPSAETEDEYDRIADDDELLLPGVTELCARLGLADEELDRFDDGSLPVYAVGDDRVLKLYPGVYAEEAGIESSVLEAIDGRLSIPTPVPDRVGEFEGWTYLLMTRLTGVSLARVWRKLPPDNRQAIAERLGTALAELHAVSTPLVELGPADWTEFIEDQRANCLDRQRESGLAARWLDQIPDFLDAVDLGAAAGSALLHCEVMGEHLLVSPGEQGWELSGLFDFEPAMRGAPEYDFASVGMFVTAGDGAALRTLLRSYGYPAAELTAETSRRFLAYALLHCSGTLPWYLRRLSPPSAPTLNAAARTWWALD
ncbi:phosphotransferase family protein [Actinoalloteichus hymeniacidonis]|uniref:Aminoglycoside phosphotransferase n=1 Tax=Actinoalloteichus hymeniacidonis TaxID=340345 RepID=A0AAC9MXD1_9PSEU|nr:aminoglycoside 3'-phosphotransferase/choline kinase family protein [Actinoalloteichus hymeniacidonis]AOS62174.1 putative aminoglycoside phosphotransferase [Actinoalloteichus hymeniacidonis]MBB5909801.1 hygromycin-B 7''-O-kinase [Actinoalloteichus hymeniacidonis]